MEEFGLFNDEGMVEGQFWSRGEADDARSSRYEPDDELTVHLICHDHEGQPSFACDECYADDADDAAEVAR